MDPRSSVHLDPPRFQNDSEEFGEDAAVGISMALTEPLLLEEGLQTSSESGEDVYMEDAVGLEGVPVIEDERDGLWKFVRWLVYSMFAYRQSANMVEECLLWVAFLAFFYFDVPKGQNKKTPPGEGLLAAAAAAAPKAAPEEAGAADIV